MKLFDFETVDLPSNPRLHQWFTPLWAAELLIERYFPDLSVNDLVLEPSCGRGAFLKALPDSVPGMGVEIDPQLAAVAAMETGRQILVGDFLELALPLGITTLIGNPPFAAKTIKNFMRRAHSLLPDAGRCGFILPAYAMQTPRTVSRWNECWSIEVELLPRTLFPNLSLPIVFALFRKDRRRLLVGFALYSEAHDLSSLCKEARDLAIAGKPHRSAWRAVVEFALDALGGQGSLDQIYRIIEPRRPTLNSFWRERVRQVLQTIGEPVSRGVWRLREAE